METLTEKVGLLFDGRNFAVLSSLPSKLGDGRTLGPPD